MQSRFVVSMFGLSLYRWAVCRWLYGVSRPLSLSTSAVVRYVTWPSESVTAGSVGRRPVSDRVYVRLSPQEEGIRLRRQLAAASAAGSSGAAPEPAPVDTTMYYVMAIVALVIGTIVGKMIL